MKRVLLPVLAMFLVLAFIPACTRTVRLQFVDAQTGATLADANVRHWRNQGTFMEFLMLLPASTKTLGEGKTDGSGRVAFHNVPWEGQFSVSKPGCQYVEVGQTWPQVRYGPLHDLAKQKRAEVKDGFAIIPVPPLRSAASLPPSCFADP